MSLFGTILSKIFPANHPAVAAAQGAQQSNQAPASSGGAPAASGQRAATPQSTAQRAGTAPPTAATGPAVDVQQVLNDKARSHPEKLNWRTSIVDLLKLLDMDSSLQARKALAQELHYSGDTNDSAAMNIWLHKQVMTKLAQNGGKVPEDLKQ